MSRKKWIMIVVLIIVLIAIIRSLFTVRNTEIALVLNSSDIKRVITEPGLHAMSPLPTTKVVYLDKRVQEANSDQKDIDVVSKDDKQLSLTPSIEWQITAPQEFYKNHRDAQYPMKEANAFLTSMLERQMVTIAQQFTALELLQDREHKFSQALQAAMQEGLQNRGLTLLQVRMIDNSVAEDVLHELAQNLQPEPAVVEKAGQPQAAALAAPPALKPAEISAEHILLEARLEAQKIRTQTQQQLAELYAKTYNQDMDFYRFYSRLQAYKKSFEKGNGILILDSQSDYLRFFKKNESD
ncbi:SPFH domain-containing protein [Brackiella oedipodis]|uniref:SPFH domain-containing protein n=1 Tax=Brackiella oedipodis TaxID=124225 RepID=UPI0004916333|nr:SPFH domain-containing protein [Brackiella oedipodis]